MSQYKIKSSSSIGLSVAISIGINVLLYALIVFLVLFTTEFNWDALFPRWIKLGEIVPPNTPGAYYDPGVLVISGIIQFIGLLLYFNTLWSKKLKTNLRPSA